MTRTHARHVLAFALAASSACACARGEDHEASADVVLDWRLELAWSVGGVADTSLLLATLKADDIAVQDSVLLLIDRNRSQIARYSSGGERLEPVGRGEGAGPGELTFPTSLAVDPSGRIIVEERVNGRISYFDAQGRFLMHRPHEVRQNISQLRAVTDSSLVGLVFSMDSIVLAIRTEHGMRPIVANAAAKLFGTAPVCSTTGYGVRTLFSPTIVFATADSTLAFTDGSGQVTFYRGDRPHAVHTHAVPRRRTSEAMAREHLGAGIRIQVQGMPPCTVPTRMLLEVAELAPELPAYASLAVDPDGVVWAMRYAVGKEPAIADVFDPETGYTGTVSLGAARPVAFLSRSLLVSLETDDDEVPVVRVYRVMKP